MSLHIIKKRKAGATSIHQMTSAMELVAATKMRKAQEKAITGRPYAINALEILANALHALSPEHDIREEDHLFNSIPLLTESTSKKIAIVVIASDKGLAGAFNASVFSLAEKYAREQESRGTEIVYITVGNKSHEYVKRRGGKTVVEFSKYGDIAKAEEALPVAEAIMSGFLRGEWGRAVSFSTTFVSALEQKPVMHTLLPFSFEHVRTATEEILPTKGRYASMKQELLSKRPEKTPEYLIEPDPLTVISTLTPLLFNLYLYHIILEANASEHSARRTAMKNATDNAGELMDTLTLAYNRLRQAAITKEIIEITGTSSAMQ